MTSRLADNPEVIAVAQNDISTATCGDSFDRDAQVYPFK